MIPLKRSLLHVELLNDRILPSVTVLDLTTAGAVATAPSGAIVEQTDPQTAGATDVQSFVRMQAKHYGDMQGYNTDARPLQFRDVKNSPNLTHSITLGQVPVVTVNGESYLEFFLGIKENRRARDISLDDVQIFVGDAGNLKGYKSSSGTLDGMSPVFDLGSAGAVEVELNPALSSGQGHWNMELLVPEAAFASLSPNSFLYLYSRFDQHHFCGVESGYVQWGVGTPVQDPPTPGSISGSVMVGNANNLAIPGVVVTLVGTDSLGNQVNLTATTDNNGNFSFTNLNPGSYSIIETPPLNNAVVGETVGTVNSVTDGTADQSNNQITNITLGSGQSGVGYVFFDGVSG